MSRVLKFRIWDKANKEYKILGATGLDARNGDVIDYYNEGNRLGGPEEYDVEQCTGLIDKNGKEIYEGDIVKYKLYADSRLDYIDEVFYSTISGAFMVGDEDNIRTLDCLINVEVIGNIHENKELLGESD